MSAGSKSEDSHPGLPYLSKKQGEDNANAYIKNCQRFDVTVDPNVVIALLTGWSILQPTKHKFSEGSLLPLMGLLDDNEHIKKLSLASLGMNDARYRAGGNGDSNARVLSQILQRNKSIRGACVLTCLPACVDHPNELLPRPPLTPLPSPFLMPPQSSTCPTPASTTTESRRFARPSAPTPRSLPSIYPPTTLARRGQRPCRTRWSPTRASSGWT